MASARTLHTIMHCLSDGEILTQKLTLLLYDRKTEKTLLMWHTELLMFTGCKPSWSYLISYPRQPIGELQTGLFFVLVLFCSALSFLCSVCVSQPNWQLLSCLNCTRGKFELRFRSTGMPHTPEKWNSKTYLQHTDCVLVHQSCAVYSSLVHPSGQDAIPVCDVL